MSHVLHAAVGMADALLSGGTSRHRLSILIYHRVLPEPDPLRPGEPDPAAFTWQMELMRQCFHVLPLAEAVDRLANGALPARAAAISFDDGYRDNAEIAAPILARLGLHATFFVATGFLGKGMMWNDRIIEALRRAAEPLLDLDDLGLGRLALDSRAARQAACRTVIDALKYRTPDERLECIEAVEQRVAGAAPELMMRPDQVRGLAQMGMEIGAHTVTHPILARIPDGAAEREISEGRAALEHMAGTPIRLFAYPNGVPMRDYGAGHVALVRRMGFKAAVSTAWGAARMGADLWQLPRFTPWDETPARFAMRLVRNYLTPVVRA